MQINLPESPKTECAEHKPSENVAPMRNGAQKGSRTNRSDSLLILILIFFFWLISILFILKKQKEINSHPFAYTKEPPRRVALSARQTKAVLSLVEPTIDIYCLVFCVIDIAFFYKKKYKNKYITRWRDQHLIFGAVITLEHVYNCSNRLFICANLYTIMKQQLASIV